MRRLFWVALGGTVGVLVVRKLGKAAQAYAPESVGRLAASWADGLHDLAGAVREGMVEREQELRVALGVDAGDVDSEQARTLLENPTGPRRSSGG